MKNFTYVFIFIALQSTDAFCSYGSDRMLERREAMRKRMELKRPELIPVNTEKRKNELAAIYRQFQDIWSQVLYGRFLRSKKMDKILEAAPDLNQAERLMAMQLYDQVASKR